MKIFSKEEIALADARAELVRWQRAEKAAWERRQICSEKSDLIGAAATYRAAIEAKQEREASVAKVAQLECVCRQQQIRRAKRQFAMAA